MLFVSQITEKNAQLTWTPPADNLRYAVYSIPADSIGYAGIVGSSRYLLGTTYAPYWPYQASAKNTYAVAVLDRYGNEYPARTKGNSSLGVSASAQLMFPTDGTSVLLPCTFTWQRANKADSYFFQLSKNADFSTVDYECETIEPSFFIGKVNWLENNVTYYWRVRTRSINATDTYSGIRSFAGTYFHIQSPEDGTRDWPVTLTIVTDSVPVQTADYHFEIATSNTFASSVLVWETNTGVPHVQVPEGKLLNSTYYYVRCTVTYDGLTAVAPACRFRTVAQDVPVPVITSPADGEQIVGTDITVSWQQQPSSGFRIELSTVESFAGRKTKVATEDYDVFSHTYTDLDPAEYYIRVKAKADGAWSEPSEVVHVTLVKPTAVEQTTAEGAPQKVLRDGQLLIRVNDQWYDILGNKTTK